jgi:hypothetical protein
VRTLPLCLLLGLALCLLLAPLSARASDPFLEPLSGEELEAAPAQKYARMGRDEAIAALKARGAIFDEVPAASAPGVLAPVRLTSRLGGVFFHDQEREAVRVRSPFEILDARLGLVLADLADLLRQHGIDEVVHMSMYRPGVHGRTASKKGPPGLRPGPVAQRGGPVARSRGGESELPSEGQTTSRHPAGLAIDVGTLVKTGGERLVVARHFGGRIGAQTCGEKVPVPAADEARELRAIVCEAAAARLFTFMLTPNYNAAHRDHLHLEIKAGAPWVLTH